MHIKKLKSVAKKNIILKRGRYLAPNYETHDFGDFLIGITEHSSPIETGIWHTHEKPIISFVLYGGNKEYRKNKMIERVGGSINFYNPYELHKNIYNTFPSKHISLEIDDAFFNKFDYSKSDIELAVIKNYDSHLTFIKLMNEIKMEGTRSRSSAEMLFVAFIENSINAKEDFVFSSWMLSVRDLLNDRWNENISLKELADKVNVHPTTISKNFKPFFQCTLGEYMRKLKVEKAISMLISSEQSLTEIAHTCGFSDQSHFTRVFKSATGYLPKQFAKV